MVSTQTQCTSGPADCSPSGQLALMESRGSPLPSPSRFLPVCSPGQRAPSFLLWFSWGKGQQHPHPQTPES